MEIHEIRNKLTQKVSEIGPLGKKLKFVLDGEPIMIDGSGNQNTITDSDGEADCTISMSKETYLQLQRKEIKPMVATMTGKIKVKGDLSLARKLKELS